MKRNWIVVLIAIVTVLASTLIVLAEGGATTNAGSPPMQSLSDATYVSLPKGLTVGGDFSFGPLRYSQFGAVKFTASKAIDIAKQSAGVRGGPTSSGSRVTVSLGSFINDEAIITDWIGTTSLIPKAIPAYVVTISGLHIESLGPIGVVNHEENVLVNASNGHVIEEFTYR